MTTQSGKPTIRLAKYFAQLGEVLSKYFEVCELGMAIDNQLGVTL